MTPRLKTLKVTNFRSILGTADVSLDAPTVLIHGPNGTGKTSLLSAIELALTRSIVSFARFDGDYIQHLPHKDGPGRAGSVDLTVSGLSAKDVAARIDVSETEIQGAPLLRPDPARFFAERCYLAQSTLGRLLEIYEHQDTRKSDSALTRFVKELMGLENLEAVIDGLHAAGDVRRLRGFTPLYWTAREQGPKWDAELAEAIATDAGERTRLGLAEANIRAALGRAADQSLPEASELRDDLDAKQARHEARLQSLIRLRRELGGATSQLQDATTDPLATAPDSGLVPTDDRPAYEAWGSGQGAELNALVLQIQASFPDVPPVLSNPARAHTVAVSAVKAEFDRLTALMTDDAASTVQLAAVATSITQAKSRLATIDLELGESKGASQDLAKALSAVAEFIDGEDCPVCGRDFTEVSETPLAAHVSKEVSLLISAAGRVQELVSDRSTTASLLSKAEIQASDLRARQLPPERRASIQGALAQLTEWRNALNALDQAAREGTRLQTSAAAVAQRQAVLSTRQTAVSGLRDQMSAYAHELGVAPSPSETPLELVVERLIDEVRRQEEAIYEANQRVSAALTALDEIEEARASLETATAERERLTAMTVELAKRRTEADRRITLAKDLAGRAQALRTTKVRQVFNEELNSLWRELFIRLAPEEAFVPAFALPSAANGAVEAILETHYRSGGKGGNPRSMLSAGNLNTAALTLFLSLHLSVKPVLPWLIIDDPVQSMDDVHIAQFAALLRTLKQDGRQVILAVHDRQLFDYLALEMSPSSNGDRLITIELGRGADSNTTAPWKLTAYEPDTAIAA